MLILFLTYALGDCFTLTGNHPFVCLLLRAVIPSGLCLGYHLDIRTERKAQCIHVATGNIVKCR